jgi:hypothetical protein
VSSIRPLLLSFAGVLMVTCALHGATFVVPADRDMVRRTPAIVVASALTSRVEKADDGFIETITVFSVEEVIKGRVEGDTVEVRAPGGVFEDGEMLSVPGSPRFEDGERYVLFLMRTAAGWHVRDMALGKFSFRSDVAGRRVLVRDENEVRGFTPEGEVHRERRRAAEPFLTFLRTTATGGPALENYDVAAEPLLAPLSPSTETRNRGLLPVTNATGNSYLIIVSGSLGPRWNVFPSPVTFTSVGTEPGAPGGGVNAINAAFASWNNDPGSNVNYVYAGADPGGHTGGLRGADGANTIMFERDLTSFGVPRFQCASNSYSGTLGLGGVSNASGTHTFNSETYSTTREADVEMNQGLANCSLLLNSGEFNSAMAHEVGHTLGFRHSDQDRNSAGACTAAVGECSNVAIMKSFVSAGLNAALQAWDQNAVRTVYRATSGGDAGPAPTFTFTDDPLVPGVTIKAIHFIELRNAANALRTFVGLTPVMWSETIAPGVVVKASHILEIRNAVAPALTALGRSATFSAPITVGTIIRAAHVQELRDRMR